MELIDQLKLEKLEIEKEVIYLESELSSADTPESIKDELETQLDEANQELLLVLSEIQDEEDKIKEKKDNKKRGELLSRLRKVSENNVAYVEAYGIYSEGDKFIELCACECVDELEAEVLKLEAALKAVNDRENQRKLDAEVKKQAAESKLAALGLSVEDFKALLS